MQQLITDLTEEEKALIEYINFELQALDNLINMFVSDFEREYKEEHINYIIDSYAERYAKLNYTVYQIAKKRGIDKTIQKFDYSREVGLLIEYRS